ncbi:hypothetical protein OROMI_026309 [Orobanche minor]
MVSTVSSGPTIARPESATVPPANSGGAIRVDREPGGRPTARRLDLQGDKVQTTVDDESDESYAAVLSGNRQAENGMLLEYVAPDMDEEGMCVCFSDDDLAEELEKWKPSLVMYVIGASHTLVYMKAWVLLALLLGDGKIEAEVKLTGILSLGALQPGESKKYGTAIAPGLYAPLHQHFFIARMDMSVDCKPGEMHNQVVEVNVRVEEPGKDNVHNNVFYAEETLLRSELEAMRDCDPLSARHWIIRNTRTVNRSGQLTGFKLVPGSNCLPLAGPEAKFLRRAAFLKHSLWVTQYARREDFPEESFPIRIRVLGKVWFLGLGKIAEPTVHQVEDSYFIVKFKSKAECDAVLRGGPYTLKNHPVVLKPWAVDFDFSKEDLNVVVVWIKLPKLPVVFQGKRSLGRIASLIGTPVV